MKLWRWLPATTLAALAVLVSDSSDAPRAFAADDLPEYVPGELLVKVRPSASDSADVTAAVDGARAAEEIESLDVTRVALPPDVSVEEAVSEFRAQPWVEYAEPNYYVRATITPNDPNYGSQSWYYNLIKAPQAWDIQTGSSAVTVAVLDTGIDTNHTDLDGKIVPGTAFISFPTDSGDADGFADCPDPHPASSYEDDYGHGSMVSGIVGAETNNALRVSGTSWGAKIMPVKVLDCNGAGTTGDVAAGITFAAQNGADIINMSLEGTVITSPPCGSTLNNAINTAVDTYGVTIVAAAGNSNAGQVACPAYHPKVIAVGASGGQSSPNARGGCPSSCFSNWGPQIDVAAPGVGICSTNNSGSWGCGSGTSFASPQVAGGAALILSQNPTFTPQQVQSALCTSAFNLADGSTPNWDGCGRINLQAALMNDNALGVYDSGSGKMRFWNFDSDGTDFTRNLAHDNCAGCWWLNKSQMVAADVNGDGHRDMVGVYDYGGGLIKMWAFLFNGASVTTVKVIYTGCGGCWYLSKSQFVATDVNGDGKDDIVGAYDYGNGTMKMWNFISNGSTISSVYKSYNGCGGCWYLSKSQMFGGDIDRDGRGDIISVYDYGNSKMGMWAFRSNGSSFTSVSKVYNGCNGCWNVGSSRFVPADVNGDGRTDMVGAYGYPGNQMGFWNFVSNGSSFTSVYKSYNGCSGCWQLSASQLQAADINGDGRDDVVGAREEGSNTLALSNFMSDGVNFADPYNAYTGDIGGWNLPQSRMRAPVY
ncbi:MAG: S8 family serine peptidase [Dehalococcoidia bacterium]